MNWLTQDELARRWGISTRTLEHWRVIRYGPKYTKIGHAVRYLKEDIEQYEKDHARICDSEGNNYADIEPAINAYANGEISAGRMRECFNSWQQGKKYVLPPEQTTTDIARVNEGSRS